MRGLVPTITALAAVSSLAVGLSSASASSHAASGASRVAVASSGLGRILVDGRGRTLYLFEKDKRGKSSCTGQCAGFWPPLIASGKPLATAGAKASLLGTTRRPDGRLQVTYNHYPLYTFVKDKSKGQTNGEGVNAFGAGWYALSPSGARVEKSKATSTDTGAPMAGGYGDGYGY